MSFMFSGPSHAAKIAPTFAKGTMGTGGGTVIVGLGERVCFCFLSKVITKQLE
jgi:hypothetical protein